MDIRIVRRPYDGTVYNPAMLLPLVLLLLLLRLLFLLAKMGYIIYSCCWPCAATLLAWCQLCWLFSAPINIICVYCYWHCLCSFYATYKFVLGSCNPTTATTQQQQAYMCICICTSTLFIFVI